MSVPKPGVPSMRVAPGPQLALTSVPATTPGHLTVRVAGDLDLVSAPRMLSELTALARAGHLVVDLDLLGVPFCDCSGVTALIEGQQEFIKRGGRLVLHNPCWSLRRILDLCDLAHILGGWGSDNAGQGSPP